MIYCIMQECCFIAIFQVSSNGSVLISSALDVSCFMRYINSQRTDCDGCVQGSEELFSTEPLPARTPATEPATHATSRTVSAEAGTAGNFVTRPRTPISTALRVDSMRHVNVERLDEDLVGGEPEVCHGTDDS